MLIFPLKKQKINLLYMQNTSAALNICKYFNNIKRQVK